jgi:hypothetical protein
MEDRMNGVNRIAALQHHLQHNHFPPLDIGWVNIADTALQAAERDEWFAVIDTPAGEKDVRTILDGLHLWEFVAMSEPEVDPGSKTVLYDGEGDADELFQVVGVVWADDLEEAGDE